MSTVKSSVNRCFFFFFSGPVSTWRSIFIALEKRCPRRFFPSHDPNKALLVILRKPVETNHFGKQKPLIGWQKCGNWPEKKRGWYPRISETSGKNIYQPFRPINSLLMSHRWSSSDNLSIPHTFHRWKTRNFPDQYHPSTGSVWEYPQHPYGESFRFSKRRMAIWEVYPIFRQIHIWYIMIYYNITWYIEKTIYIYICRI